jgi:17beta-estradiol 17-dehydrogenase / very-long-chain 3-oxoacyl-CoA reductase
MTSNHQGAAEFFVTLLIVWLAWKFFIPLLYLLFKFTIGKTFLSRRRALRKSGEWAIVTGATDGIGKAYANELAKDGLNIMLVSRSMEKLHVVADDIGSRYGVQTRIVACDFTKTDIYDNLEKEINNLSTIACLVNNVGMSYPHFDAFATADFLTIEFIEQLIACNMNSMACMTRIVLPRMLKQSTLSPAIINVGSFSGLIPMPFLSLYGASKAFVVHFTEVLYQELGETNIILQAVCPSLVSTKMSKVKPRLFVPTPEAYVSSALSMIGVETITLGYLPHALEEFGLRFLPKSYLKAKGEQFMKRGHKKA